MTLLEFSQIFFDLVGGLAVIIITVFISVIAYNIIRFFRVTKEVVQGISRESSELYHKIDSFLEKAMALKFITNFFTKKSNKKKHEED